MSINTIQNIFRPTIRKETDITAKNYKFDMVKTEVRRKIEDAKVLAEIEKEFAL